MIRTTVVSAAITAVAYDAQSRALEVEYVSGRAYRYLDVPEDVFARLLEAGSKGSFVNKMIRDRYAYTQVPTRPAAADDLMATLQASLAPPDHPHGNRRSTR